MDIAVLFLGELVGRLDGVTDGGYWAKQGNVAWAYPAENCELVPYENIDWNAIYKAPPDKEFLDSIVVLTPEYFI